METESGAGTRREPISVEFRAKGTIAVLTDIIAGFAVSGGFSIDFKPGGRPDWSARVADMRMYGPIKSVDSWSPRKEHQIGWILLQQLPDDICLISIESKESIDQADELEAFYVALYEHLKGLRLYLPPLTAERPI